MQSLGQNNAPFSLLRLFRHLVWASYNQDSWPHLPSLARRRIPFSFYFSMHAMVVHFHLDGTETSPFFCLLLYQSCMLTNQKEHVVITMGSMHNKIPCTYVYSIKLCTYFVHMTDIPYIHTYSAGNTVPFVWSSLSQVYTKIIQEMKG